MSLMQCLAFTAYAVTLTVTRADLVGSLESQSRAAGALTTTFYTNIFGLEAAAANAARLDHDLRRRRAAYFT
jgi:hypothetical protein